MGPFTIREACIEDAEKMIAHLKQIGGESDNLTFGAEGLPLTKEMEEKTIESMRRDPRSVMLVAESEGQIIGEASLRGMPRRMSHRAELGISVKKKYWNQGVGTALMEALIQYACANEIEILALDVREDNERAVHLYKRYGFTTCGRLPALFKIGDTYADFIHMELDLREND